MLQSNTQTNISIYLKENPLFCRKLVLWNGGETLANKFDINVFNDKVKCIEIGKLTPKMIRFLNLSINPCSIMLWDDRLKYMEKYKSDFISKKAYYKHLQEIPNIIENPDYIGLHPKDNSIQFIKRIDELMLVGVRIKNKGSLNIRSSYPISNEQLQTYLDSNTAWEFRNIDTNE